MEEALELFEEGMKISKFCNSRLDEAERKVEVLLKDNVGKLVEKPFDPKQEPKKT